MFKNSKIRILLSFFIVLLIFLPGNVISDIVAISLIEKADKYWVRDTEFLNKTNETFFSINSRDSVFEITSDNKAVFKENHTLMYGWIYITTNITNNIIKSNFELFIKNNLIVTDVRITKYKEFNI